MTKQKFAPPFWMVWNPSGHAPTHKHASLNDAVAEARRLAAIVPGQHFYVLAAVKVAHTIDPVTVVDLADDLADDIPF